MAGMRTVPKPSGITNQPQGGGWHTLAWKPVPGIDDHGYESEYQWGSGKRDDPESVLFAVSPGSTDWCRIRNVVDGVPSGWVKVTINSDGEIIDIDGGDPPPPPRPPGPPSGLRVVSLDVEEGTATVGWDDADDADSWQVLLEGSTRWRKATVNRYTFRGLNEGETYGWRVRAVNTNGTSAPTRDQFVFEDHPVPPPTPPNPPTGLTVHCITEQSAKAEWDDDPDTDDWEVWLDHDRDNSFATTKTLVAITELVDDTPYTVNVVARVGEPGTPGYAESDPSTVGFRTLEHEEKPPPPPPPIHGDLPAPTNFMVRADSATQVRATWDDTRPNGTDAQFWYVTVDRRSWLRVDRPEAVFGGLAAGREYTVAMFGVYDRKLTDLSARAATTKGAR